MVPQIHLASWVRPRTLRGLGEWVWGVLVWDKFKLENLGAWPCKVKTRQHQVFLDSGPLASEQVPVLKFQPCPGALYPWLGEKGLWCWVQLEARVQLHGLWFRSFISKNSSAPQQTG